MDEKILEYVSLINQGNIKHNNGCIHVGPNEAEIHLAEVFAYLNSEGEQGERQAVYNVFLTGFCKYGLLADLDLLIATSGELFHSLDQPIDFCLSSSSRFTSLLNTQDQGLTPLGLAAKHGQLDIVSYLIEVRDCNPNQIDNFGNYPLHNLVLGDVFLRNNYILGNGHKKIAKYLLVNGADPFVENSDGLTPLKLIESSLPELKDIITSKETKTMKKCLGFNVRPFLQDYLPASGCMPQHKSFPDFALTKSLKRFVKKGCIGSELSNSLINCFALSDKSKQDFDLLSQAISRASAGGNAEFIQLLKSFKAKKSKESFQLKDAEIVNNLLIGAIPAVIVALSVYAASVYSDSPSPWFALFAGSVTLQAVTGGLSNSTINKAKAKNQAQEQRADEILGLVTQ